VKQVAINHCDTDGYEYITGGNPERAQCCSFVFGAQMIISLMYPYWIKLKSSFQVGESFIHYFTHIFAERSDTSRPNQGHGTIVSLHKRSGRQEQGLGV
jgi:hypothetical protein